MRYFCKKKRKLVIGIIVCQFFLCSFQIKNLEIVEAAGSGIPEEISVQELDLGEYKTLMEVEERQLLTVTVLPLNASEQKIQYKSENESIATINGMGRITAISPGNAEIVVSCGKITERFVLTVTKKEKGKHVEDIEISGIEDTLEVGETIFLLAKIMPEDAVENTIIYSTSNASVATVGKSGEVKGIAQGNVRITVKAGEIEKNIELKVKVRTTAIQLEKAYIVLKEGDSYQIKANVLPKEATQEIAYKSANKEIAEVNSIGIVTAKQTGTTTIFISNGDMSNALTVIVNEELKNKNKTDKIENNGLEGVQNEEILLIHQLEQQDCTVISAIECRFLSKEVLKYLQKEKKTIIIMSDNWILTIDGNMIVNWENELDTNINFERKETEIKFTLNNGKRLPGELELRFSDIKKYPYTYLYNASKKKYEHLDQPTERLILDQPGEYLLRETRMESFRIYAKIFLILGGLLMVGIVVGYIIIKKRII